MMALTAQAQTPVEDLFELDGNLIDESTIADPDDGEFDDWGRGDVIPSAGYVAGPLSSVDPHDPGGSAEVSAFIADKNGDTGMDDIFTGGGSKDDLPIEGWKWTIGTPPDKDDLLAVGAAAYSSEVPGELLIYDFGTLYAANGTSSIGNWFFKKDIGECEDGSFGVVDSSDPNRSCLPKEQQPESLHTIGDVLVISENSNGGTVTNISVYRWVAGIESECDEPNESFVPPKNNLCLIGDYASATCGDPNAPPEAAFVCGVMNQMPTESVDDYEYMSKSPLDEAPPDDLDGIWVDDHPAFTFFESGINLKEVLKATECFASFMKNTRTSASPRSQLKDFAGGSFSVCGIEAFKDCDAALTSAGDQVVVDYWGTVSNTGAIAIDVSIEDSEPGSVITAVCYDLGGELNVCDDTTTDPEPDGLAVGTTATFVLYPGETVLFEGYYTFAGQITTLAFTDIITAIAKVGGNEVARAEPGAYCVAEGHPSIYVEKACTAQAIANGTLMEVTVTGNGLNNGDVKLKNVTLTDLVDPAVQSALWITKGGEAVTNGAFDLLVGETFAFGAIVTEGDTIHSDQIKAEGSNAFNLSEKTEAFADASCNLNALPGITVTKECKPALNINNEVPGKIVIQIDFSGQICNDSAILGLTDVALTDTEAGSVTLSKTILDPTECISYSGSYFPVTPFSGGAPPNTSLFWDQVHATGIGTLGTGPVEDFAEDDCTLCE
jgi:hypothetical protein